MAGSRRIPDTEPDIRSIPNIFQYDIPKWSKMIDSFWNILWLPRHPFFSPDLLRADKKEIINYWCQQNCLLTVKQIVVEFLVFCLLDTGPDSGGGGKGGNASPLIPFCPPPQISAPPGSCPGGGKEFLGSLPLSQRKLTVLLSNAIIKPKNLNLNNGYLNIKCHFEVNIDYSLYWSI